VTEQPILTDSLVSLEVPSQISPDLGVSAVPLMLVLNVPMLVVIFALPVKETMTSANDLD
jgi:hypothetical protein